MPTLLKKVELARCLGINPNIVNVNFQRKKLVIDNNRLINIDDPINKLWIQRQIESGCTFDLNRINEKEIIPKKIIVREPVQNPIFTEIPKVSEIDKEEISKLYIEDDSLTNEKKKLEIIKLKNQNKKDELQIKKIEGQLIPTDAAETVFIWAINQFEKTFENNIENIISIELKSIGIENNKLSQIRKQTINSIRDCSKEAKDAIMNGIENVVNEYSEVRARGERR